MRIVLPVSLFAIFILGLTMVRMQHAPSSLPPSSEASLLTHSPTASPEPSGILLDSSSDSLPAEKEKGSQSAAVPAAGGSSAAGVNPIQLPIQVSPATIELPPIDMELAAANARREAQLGIYRFAEPIHVDIHPDNSGRWSTLSDGRERWQVKLNTQGARSINLAFLKYVMPEGGELELIPLNPAHRIRPFTAADNKDHQELWTPIIPGDSLTVQVTLPSDLRNELQLLIGQVNHGHRGNEGTDYHLAAVERPAAAGIQQRSAEEQNFPGFTGACHIDVVCESTDLPGVGSRINQFRDQIRSVVRISIGGTGSCSGALIGNTAGTPIPYILTAEHCGVTPGNDQSLVIYFNYQNSFCRELNTFENVFPGDGVFSQFSCGTTLRALAAEGDFCLVELENDVPESFNPYFSGWDRNTSGHTRTIGIHHPNSMEKRISFDNQPPQPSDYIGLTTTASGPFHRVFWDDGITAVGSSGSPLYNQNKRIIGNLCHGGSFCGVDDPDWYGRVSWAWTGGNTLGSSLSSWLDPLGTGETAIDGYNISPGISIDDVTQVEMDNGSTNFQFTVSLDRPSDNLVTVRASTEEDSAIAPEDFTSFANQLVSFSPGTTQNVVNVSVNGDTTGEPNEIFRVKLTGASNATIGDDTGVGIIENDDTSQPPVLTTPRFAIGEAGKFFSFQITGDNEPTSFEIGNPPQGMFVNSFTGKITWTPTQPGTYPLNITISNIAGSDSGVITIVVEEDQTFNALLPPGQTGLGNGTTLEPGTDWFAQPWCVFEGEEAVQSGRITHNQQSVLNFVVNAPTTVFFYWKVSCEENFDWLEVYIDNTMIRRITGETDWSLVSLNVPRTTISRRTISIRYVKDGAISLGQDAGFIDSLQIGGIAPVDPGSGNPDLPIVGTNAPPAGIVGAPYQFRIPAQNATSYTTANLPEGLILDPSSGLITGVPLVSGQQISEIGGVNSDGTTVVEVPFLVIDPATVGLVEASFVDGHFRLSALKPEANINFAVEHASDILGLDWSSANMQVIEDGTDFVTEDRREANTLDEQYYRLRLSTSSGAAKPARASSDDE